MAENIWMDGIMGSVVGDALGVPVEFHGRADLRTNPVTGMRSFGTHHQPAGTWSDDSSMTLAAVASIREKGELDFKDMMDRFSRWTLAGEYSPFQAVFDIGISTSKAIMNYGRGMEPEECGGKREGDNGNGSLMRILPVCLYCYEKQKAGALSVDEITGLVHSASRLTHAHLRSQIACGLFYFCVEALLETEGTLAERLQAGMSRGFEYYDGTLQDKKELSCFDRLRNLTEFADIPQEQIRSSGYVVDTLEAAVWCLLTTGSYRECVLKAVNLGEDTDTTAVVAGGLAGIYYGYKEIPEEWLAVIQKREWIKGLLAGE